MEEEPDDDGAESSFCEERDDANDWGWEGDDDDDEEDDGEDGADDDEDELRGCMSASCSD